MKISKILALTAALLFGGSANAQYLTDDYGIIPLVPGDGGIFMSISANGEWATTGLGSSSTGGNATSNLYEVWTGAMLPIQVSNRTFSVYGVTDDGNTVVGQYAGRPAYYDREAAKLKLIPLRDLWMSGSLEHVTPDGKWAVGSYNGYSGKISDTDELNHDYYYSPLFVNLETGDTIPTPGLPKLDRSGMDNHAMVFKSITPDGRYILGLMSWYILQPASCVVFLYDTQEHNYRVIGFKENPGKEWKPLFPNLYNIGSEISMSPNGRYLGGMAYTATPIEGSQFNTDLGVPFRYDIEKDELSLLTDCEINIESAIIDDEGTLYVNPETGSPLRDFRIFYKDKYLIGLNQICRQQYGFDFMEKTGFDRTGTIMSVSGNGKRFVSMVDPTGESYVMGFSRPMSEICDGIDLLDNYSVTPVNGAVISELSTIEINFGRNVQVLGTGKNVHLYDADGNKVADGLSAGNQGLQLKSGSKTAIVAVFRPRALETGKKYYVVIDAGAIAVGNDDTRVNKEIRIEYEGRPSAPVAFQKVAPEAGSTLQQIDASSSYILVSFDYPVQLTDTCNAYVMHKDGTVISSLTAIAGSTPSTSHQLLIYPPSPVYFYDGLEYTIVIEGGSVTDYSGSAKSANERISFSYMGSYVRVESLSSTLFSDNFNNLSESLVTWLRYEGDHNTPQASMQAWEFDKDNQPWNLSIRDFEDSQDYCAASHSLYAPSGQSDDWMMTPQIIMPTEGKVFLSFDAQGYNPNKQDVLKVYIYEDEWIISYLNKEWIDDIKQAAILLDSIVVDPGDNQEKLGDEWTHYEYDLTPWLGKSIYVAFVNQNNNQSVVFVDNVSIEREELFTLAFSNEDRVIAADNISIAGQITIKNKEQFSSMSLTLKDAAGETVSVVNWPTISGNMTGRTIPFAFDKALPLTVGDINVYSIDVAMGDKVVTYNGKIQNLAFKTTRRVVLEEMTGIDCPNCPQGILTIEKLEKQFGEQFIPISIHSYSGDPYAGTMSGYSGYLNLNAAPSARIDRINGIYYPMISDGGKVYDTYPTNPLWYDIVVSELAKLTPIDVNLEAMLNEAGDSILYYPSIRSAINLTNQQMSVLAVVLEDGLENYQDNNFGTSTDPIFGEWGANGIYSGAENGGYAYPVIHNDVARMLVGLTLSGTTGLFPQDVEAGVSYSTNFASSYPSIIDNPANASVVAMLIDTQTGEVINAAKSKLLPYSTAIAGVDASAATSRDVYSLSGVLLRQNANAADINALPRGMYIVGGKKVLVR